MAFSMASACSRSFLLNINRRFAPKLQYSLHYNKTQRAELWTDHKHHKGNELSDAHPIVPRQFNLTFNEYLELKRTLRFKQRIGGVLFGLTAGMATNAAVFVLNPHWFEVAPTPEQVPLVFGQDPIMVTVGLTMVGSLCGYGLGCVISKFAWSVFNRSKWNDLNARDADFLSRLDKHRFVGDSSETFEEDFYGESIKSASDYRQWVRQHQRKRENHIKFNSSLSS